MEANAGIRPGGKVGLTFAKESVSSKGDVQYDIGMQYGTIVEFLLEGSFPFENLYYETGISYFQKGIKTSFESRVPPDDVGSFSTVSVFDRDRLGYIDIPFDLKYKIPLNNHLKVYGTFGGYFDIAVEGKNASGCDFLLKSDLVYPGHSGQLSGYENDTKIKFGTGSNDKYKRIDCGFRFGVGFEAVNHILLGVTYSMGLNNIYNNNYQPGPAINPVYSSVKNRVWSLYIAYLF